MTLPVDLTPPPVPPGRTELPMCIGCDRRNAGADSLTCKPCRSALVRQLDYIADGYRRLDPTPVAGGSGGGRGAPGYSSRSPARDDVLALTDMRGAGDAPGQPGNALSVPAVLGVLLDRAVVDGPLAYLDDSRIPGAAVDVRLAVGVLLDVVADLARCWSWPELARDVATLAGRVRRALGEHDRAVPLGRCPRPAPGWEAARAELNAAVGPVMAARAGRLPQCGGQVRGTPGFGAVQRVECRTCWARWEGAAEVRALAAQLGDAVLDLPGLSRYLGVESLATLRSWAHRDGWRRERRGGRTLYALADARRSWWSAWDRANPWHGCDLPPQWPALTSDGAEPGTVTSDDAVAAGPRDPA